MSEYALYEGDTFITMGTLAEISKETGIAERCKYFRVYHRRYLYVFWD
ncbi:TPA: hypothetical protein ACJVP0_000026 [Streptococcus pneumoniae]